MPEEVAPSAPMNEFERRWRKFYDVPATAGPIAVQSAAGSETQVAASTEQPSETVDA